MRTPLLVVLALVLASSATAFAADAVPPTASASTPPVGSTATDASAIATPAPPPAARVRLPSPTPPQPAAPVSLPTPSPGPTLAPSIQPSIFAPKMPRLPPRDSAPRSRPMSPEMASKLGVLVDRAVAALPPPPPKPPEVQDEGSPDVLRMDPFIVEEERPPDLRERHILTKKGTEALMRKQYPALQNLGPVPLFNGYAMKEVREDDLRKERRLEMQELYGRLGAPSAPVKKAVDEMRSRPIEPRPQNGTPFKEPQR